MIGRRCTHSNVFSRPVLIARDLLSSQTEMPGIGPRRAEHYLSQVTYCGGYSGDEPPLPIPNREVKLTSADGTAPPGGRVGRCRFSEPRLTMSAGVLSLYSLRSYPESARKSVSALRVRTHWGRNPPNPLGRRCLRVRQIEGAYPLEHPCVAVAPNYLTCPETGLH